MAERKLEISPLGDSNKQELSAAQPVNLVTLRDKLPKTTIKYPWARKMGPQ